MSKYEIEEIQSVSSPNNTEKKNDIILQPEELPVLPSINNEIPPTEKEEMEETFTPLTENLDIPISENEDNCIKHKLFGSIQKRKLCDRNLQPSETKKNTNIGTYLLLGSIVATIGAKFI